MGTEHGQRPSDPQQPAKTRPLRPLFPELAAVPWTTGDPVQDEAVLKDLGAAMHTATRKNGTIPAGFTYFGQFVDHDLTFDPTSIGENAVDVDDLVNFRTPALNLDSVYGSGPRDQPYLHQRNSGTASSQMLVGPVVKVPPGAPGGADAQVQELDGALYDLPRIADGLPERTAVLGDKRNDENLIVAQLNLIRGAKHYKLPSGQALAARMGMAPLSKTELESGATANVVQQHQLGHQTPLWFFILKEAGVIAGGAYLGPMGAAIVAEVIVGLIKDDPESLLNAGTPRSLPKTGAHFAMADLFLFVESKKDQGNIRHRA